MGRQSLPPGKDNVPTRIPAIWLAGLETNDARNNAWKFYAAALETDWQPRQQMKTRPPRVKPSEPLMVPRQARGCCERGNEGRYLRWGGSRSAHSLNANAQEGRWMRDVTRTARAMHCSVADADDRDDRTQVRKCCGADYCNACKY